MLPAVMGRSCTPPSTFAMSSGFIAASLAAKSTVRSMKLFTPLPLPTD